MARKDDLAPTSTLKPVDTSAMGGAGHLRQTMAQPVLPQLGHRTSKGIFAITVMQVQHHAKGRAQRPHSKLAEVLAPRDFDRRDV